MSNNSAKRIKQQTKIPLILLSIFLYIPILLKLLEFIFKIKTLNSLFSLALIIVVGIVTKNIIQKDLNQGLPLAGYMFDIYCINSTVAILSLIWDWAWYIYLLVPGFLTYKLFVYLFNQVSKPVQQPQAVQKKQQIKKKQKRKVKYIK